jgi:RNA polymerase sigma factor (sigma-70 family)
MPEGARAERSVQTEPTDGELLQRFTQTRDGGAFEALVLRHGPMVLAVCRRVLGHTQDAEDAFQGTFLVLARRAAPIARPELLGNWLYGVAYRTACKARLATARRCQRERMLAALELSAPPETASPELRTLLHEELEQLPARYRAPLVLCYLEGLTNQEAARRLGWPAGSISYRLARGRQMLHHRLVKLLA